MLSELMPIAALIAGLLAVGDLLRHRELIVVWSSGVRPVTILRMLLPAGLALVAGKFAIDDVAVPRATTALRLWGIGDYRHRPVDGAAGDFYWLRSGNDIVRLSANAAAVGEVTDITIFRRGDDGILTERLEAASATTAPGGWRLEQVTRAPRRRRMPSSGWPTLDWPGDDRHRPDPAAGPPAARAERSASCSDVIAAGGYGLRAREPYLTWAHQRVAGRLHADVPDAAGLRPGAPVQPHRLDRARVHDRGRDRLLAADPERGRQRAGRGRLHRARRWRAGGRPCCSVAIVLALALRDGWARARRALPA